MASSTLAVSSLTNAITGAGSTVDFLTAVRNVSAVMIPTGTVTGGAVDIEVSHDGTNWVPYLTMHIALRPGIHSHDFSVGAYRYWRASIVQDITGGGNVTTTFMQAG